ncbi:phage tail tube protein [Asaia krungthepensis]|uniref:Uncharacterized protein n=1 Tax=Asaia krungthepensis NRIC 0535 TaxID=1307925 RepID=A0ABQ0Q379_9PROT|nr:phage tail tube protein [Asaia krungthepensis]GBQ89255.1 hypothetical protein AA0535_1748 [Asaia krungthepensis NRIC 0535]
MSDARVTSGWAAGLLWDESTFGIARESRYGERASDDFQLIRLSGGNFKLTQSRTYLDEAHPLLERAAGVASSYAGSGSLEALLSFGNHDALMAAALCGVWRDGAVSNGAERSSWTLRQRLGGGWLYRQGVFVRAMELTVAQGDFIRCAFDTIHAREAIVTGDDAALDHPFSSREALHPCKAQLAATLPGQIDPGILRRISLKCGREDAALDYGARSPCAQDVRLGSFAASGSLDLVLRGHDAFEALVEAQPGPLSFTIIGSDGYGYAFRMPRTRLYDAKIDACSRRQLIMATVEFEAAPSSGDLSSLNIHRLAPSDADLITVDHWPVLNNSNTISP